MTNPAMTRGAVASTLLHAAILAALLFSFPVTRPDDSPPAAEVQFEIESDQPQQVAKADERSPAPPATASPAAPPRPASQPAAAAPAVPRSPAPPPVPPPPLPLPSDISPAPLPLPTPPRPAPPRPTPPSPAPRPQPPAPASPAAPPKPAPDLRAVDNALARFRLAQQQAPSAAARSNPGQGAPNGGGSPSGDITSKLTGEQRGAIGDKVRECWTKDEGALDLEKMSVLMTVTVDAAGVVREAVVGDADRAKLADPRFRAFAERARRANLDGHCADLSNELPKAQLGRVVKLTFRFRP